MIGCTLSYYLIIIIIIIFSWFANNTISSLFESSERIQWGINGELECRPRKDQMLSNNLTTLSSSTWFLGLEVVIPVAIIRSSNPKLQFLPPNYPHFLSFPRQHLLVPDFCTLSWFLKRISRLWTTLNSTKLLVESPFPFDLVHPL